MSIQEPEGTEGTEGEEEVIEEEEVDKVDKRLLKSVNRMKKELKIKDEVLKGLSVEEQFDRLEFMADNMPKFKKTKNKPIVGLPTDADAPKIGRFAKGEHGETIYLLKPHEWLNRKKK